MSEMGGSKTWMPIDGRTQQVGHHTSGRMAINWGRYSPIKMQYLKERKPQKLWVELLGKSFVGLVYWTALVEFLRNLFWFQLKSGGLAPQIGFLAYLFIPSVAVGRPFFRQFLDSHPWSRALLVVGGVLGLWGELQASALRRLTLSACGVGLLGIYIWEGMWAATTARRERTAFGMVGGILLLQVLRWAYAGPNPLVARWWGLLFLGIIPGVCASYLVLCEDLAESEGEQLQSFIEEDEDVELENIELASNDEDGAWRFKKVEVVSFSGRSSNGEERIPISYPSIGLSGRSLNGEDQIPVNSTSVSLFGRSLNGEGRIPVSYASTNEVATLHPTEEMKTSARVASTAQRDGELLDAKLQDQRQISPPEVLGNGKIQKGSSTSEQDQRQSPLHGLGNEKSQQGASISEQKTIGEILETNTIKPTLNDAFQEWSWGFGEEAFREARTGIAEREAEVVDPHVRSVTESFDSIHSSSSPMKKTRRSQLIDESFNGIRATGSPKSIGSPMKNKRWGEGEEVPWLMDIRGDQDISESELDLYRHKDTKWNIGSCMRTAQMGIGSGSLLFLTHWILTATTSFPRWQGLPAEFGWVSILSLVLGLVAATEYPRVLCLRRTQGLVFWVVAALGASLLMWSVNGAMVGGALLAFSAPSLWISIAQCNLEKYPGGGLSIMVLVYITFVLWSTSLVAYQSIHVLGFLRGTRGILMGCAVAGVGLGVGREPVTASKERAAHGGIWRGLFTSEIDARGRQAVGALIAVVGIIATVALGVRLQHTPITGNLLQQELKVLNFNVQQGFSRSGTANYDTVLSMLHKEQPHFVMLQETDMMHIAHGNLDMIDYWSTWLRMHSLYTPPTKSDTWGCALLSFYPFIYSESGVLTSPKGENACYQYAQVLVAGNVVHLLNTHFGTSESEIVLQAAEMAALIQQIVNQPGQGNAWLLLGGDLNAAPLSLAYNITISAGLEDAYVSQNGKWRGPWERDPGAGYVFSSPTFNCTSWEEPQYDQQKTADGYPVVAAFKFF